MVDEFNNIDVDVVVLLVIYAVSAQGLNLDPQCSRILVTTSAAEIQAWGCVLQVSYIFISV